MKNHGCGTTKRVRSCVKRALLEGMHVRILLINLVIMLFFLVGGGGGGIACCFMSLLEASCCHCGSCWLAPLPPFRSHRWLLAATGLVAGQAEGTAMPCHLPSSCFLLPLAPATCVVLLKFPTEGVGWGPFLGWRGCRQVGFAPLSASRCLCSCCRKTMEEVNCVGWLFWGV